MGIVEDLEEAIDIVDLVSRYTKLKKSGANYKALCPFPGHNEKTPSFIVSPSKQIGYCFGCHKGGGVVKFIMDIENCEFREALEILGNYTGIQVHGNFDKKKFEEKKSLYGLYKDVVSYYTSTLKNYPEVKKYLYERGLNSDIIRDFYIGYSDSGIELYNYLKSKGYEDKLIEDAQIFVNLSAKKDKFIGRIIFSIQNSRGDFVGFAGRIIHSGEPKYINSPASKIYDKSNILYNLFTARSQITKEDFVIIAEGYMDVIALHRGGFLNTVAVSGTALTDKHITLLKRLTRKIYLCFDGDEAGKKATKLSLEKMKNKGLEVKIILLPRGKDPDNIINSGKDFREYIEKALTPIAYFIKISKVDINSIDEKKKLLLELLDLIGSYSDNIEKDYYLQEVSHLLEIRENIVYDTFNKIRFSRKKENFEERNNYKKTEFYYEDLVMGYMILDEKNIDFFRDNIIFLEETSQDLQNIIQKGNTTIKNFQLEKREKLKGLSLRLEIDQKKSDTDRYDDLKKVAFGINKELFTKKLDSLKTKMKQGDNSAFLQYTEVIQKGKEFGLK